RSDQGQSRGGRGRGGQGVPRRAGGVPGPADRGRGGPHRPDPARARRGRAGDPAGQLHRRGARRGGAPGERPGAAGGQRGSHPGDGPRGRRDRRRLPRGGRAHPLRGRSGHRAGPAEGLMLLAVDFSNTHTVLGLFDGEEVIEHWRIATDPRRTADEIAVVLQGLLAQSPLLKNADISGIAICSTVPSVLNEMREMSRRYYGDVPTVVVEPGVRTGVPVRMDNPKEVGADRVVNALAAYTLYRGPCVVVDFGTATSFDAVSAKGEYVGAVTAPGIEISVDALASAGAQLHKVELVRPR